MKAGWTTTKLMDQCSVITKGTTPTSIGHKFTTSGPNFIKIESITQAGTFITSKFANISFDAHEALKRSQLKQGDILFSIAGALGRTAIVDATILPANTNQALAIIRLTDEPHFYKEYLRYFFTSELMIEQIEKLKGGAAQQNLSLTQLKELQIPLPPLEEQKRIVSILDEAFEGLDRARENAEANLKSARELFESVLHASFSEDVNWNIAALNKHVQFVDYRGKTPPKMQNGIRLITAKNVKRGFINREPEEFMDQDAYDDWMTRGYPEFGDVLFTTEAPLANVALLDTFEKVVIGQRLITMKPDKGIIDSSFLCYALLSPKMQETIIAQGTGATVLGIKAKLLKAIPLRFPKDIRHQRDIAASCLKAFQNKCRLEATYNAKLQDISDLRQSLLQKAFAGELT